MAKKTAQTVTIDGKEYNLADLSENAKAQLMNLQAVDQEIARCQRLIAINQTARNSYAAALQKELPTE